MKNCLIVTGTCGVGKSTVTWKWADEQRCAYIDGDALRWSIRDKDLRRANNYQEALITSLCLALAKGYLNTGLSVAIDNVWRPSGISFLYENLNKIANVVCVYLKCEVSVNQYRDSLREGNDRMGQRVIELHEELSNCNWPPYVHQLDTTHMTIESTLENINQWFK